MQIRLPVWAIVQFPAPSRGGVVIVNLRTQSGFWMMAWRDTADGAPCGFERCPQLWRACEPLSSADTSSANVDSDISLPGEMFGMWDAGGERRSLHIHLCESQSISGYCVKRNGSAKSAYSCTAAVAKFAWEGEMLSGSRVNWHCKDKIIWATLVTWKMHFLAVHPACAEVTMEGKWRE